MIRVRVSGPTFDILFMVRVRFRVICGCDVMLDMSTAVRIILTFYGVVDHPPRNLGTGKPTNPVPNPYKKQHKTTNDTKHHQYKIDDNNMIDKKHNEFTTSIRNDPNLYGHSYGFIPPTY